VAINKVDSKVQPSILGMSYHFGQRKEKAVIVKVKKWTSLNSLPSIVVGAARRTKQAWDIVGTEVEGWVEMIVANVDGREHEM